jgi:hypothetical protein
VSGQNTPEIEYLHADGPAPGRWTGLTGMAAAFRDVLSAWKEWRVVADEYRELDGERVLVLSHYSARGKASGLEVGQIWNKGASLFEVSGGKVTRLVNYFDRDRAFADLGLASDLE